MNRSQTKIRHVFIPYLLLAVGIIAGYGLLRWFLDIKLGVIPLKQDVIDYWLPIAFTIIGVLIVMRKRVRILDVRGKRGNGYFAYQLIVMAIIAISLLMSQDYMKDASYSLIKVDGMEKIVDHPDQKFFEIERYQVAVHNKYSYVTSRRTWNRNDPGRRFYRFYSYPFEGDAPIWFGVKYTEKVSNSLSEQSKIQAYQRFLQQTSTRYKTHPFYEVTYFERLRYSDDLDGFKRAIDLGDAMIDLSTQVVLVAKYDPFESRLGNSLPWFIGTFGFGSIVFLVMVLVPRLDEREYRDFKLGTELKDDDTYFLLSLFNPRGTFTATPILLLLNVGAFIVMVAMGMNIMSPTPQELLGIGGLRRFEVLQGEYWRLLTSVFLHAGFLHLFLNLVGLIVGSTLLEKTTGAFRLILLYLLFGIIAGLASIWWNDHGVSIGASGAIFGLYGL
ncbi:MAG: rhomboid family intramembrane serine protease, partial [Bacteroidota bacterium]